jgi:hypothetical protein
VKGRHLRGSTEQCPKCGCRKVGFDPALSFKGYGPGIAACTNCSAIWEPFRPEHIWDKDEPLCAFKEPCDNCAFRPGSTEQEDREKWIGLLDSLRMGGRFYCHKGVPIESGAEHGFACPYKEVMVEGRAISIPDTSKLRLCRGFLNAAPKLQRWGVE